MFHFLKNSLRNMSRMLYGLDQDQDQRCVGPNLGTNCLQRQKSALARKEIVMGDCTDIGEYVSHFDIQGLGPGWHD